MYNCDHLNNTYQDTTIKLLLFLFISVSISCPKLQAINDCSETRPSFDQHNSPLPVVHNKQTQSYEIKTKSHYTEHLLSVIGKLAATLALAKLLLFCNELSELPTKNDHPLEKIAYTAEWHHKLACLLLSISFVSLLKTLHNGPALNEKVIVKEV